MDGFLDYLRTERECAIRAYAAIPDIIVRGRKRRPIEKIWRREKALQVAALIRERTR